MAIIIRRCANKGHLINILGFKYWPHTKWFATTHGICSRHYQEQLKEIEQRQLDQWAKEANGDNEG